METLAIGERKVFTDVTLEVVSIPKSACTGCWFRDQQAQCYENPYFEIMGHCAAAYRDDGMNVIFEAVKGKEEM